MTRSIVCIVCPKGCRLTVDDDLNVTGNSCPRGIPYGKAEVSHPTRLVSSTVKVISGLMRRLPVVTSGEIPKDRIFDIMIEINRLEVTAPIKINDVLIKNVLGLGVDIVATRSLSF